MAENLKPYNAPQQNRRNKRRFTTTTQTNQQEQPQPTSHIFQTNLTSFLQLNPPTKPPPASSSSSSLQSLHQTNFYTPFDPFPLNMHAQAQHYYSGFADSLKLQKSEVRSSVPWGPFTGYASILKRSRFLKPAQRILDEFCGTLYFDSSGSQVDSFCENPVVRDFIAFSDRIERSWKTSKLVLMLEEVSICKRSPDFSLNSVWSIRNWWEIDPKCFFSFYSFNDDMILYIETVNILCFNRLGHLLKPSFVCVCVC